jgi:membrane protease YdiL (CAAX protease family)
MGTKREIGTDNATVRVMQDDMKGNQEFRPPDIFSALNNYVLLFFGVTCILSSVFIQQLFYTMNQLHAGILIAPILGIILPVYAIAHRFPAGFRTQFLIRRPRVLLSLYVLVATLAVIVIIDYAYTLSQRFMTTPDDYVEGLKELKPRGNAAMVMTFLGICVLVPIAEEIVFRGLVQRVFMRNMGGVLALVLAGVFFGVIHLTPQLMLSMVVFGIFLGYLFFVTSNLTYPILAHCVLNTVSYIQLLTLPENELASAPPYAHSYWMLLLSFVIVFYLLARIKKGASAPAKTPYDSFDDSNAA